ncbi:MAG: UDP-N-acetylmuramoyl-tripeptide--D-alanyl-D-alanine ligase [Candidatus Omnitrophica bacterium]|nr:UDP-N-acetylmuramoyl-tripeptide--D-alanyl-D-alanine ligase [Candidatus Omnitrophota bacterium]
MFKVNELLKATAGHLVSGSANAIIKGVSIDSRTIKGKEAFIAIKGDNFDGHDFIEEAINKGASCIIKENGEQRTEDRGEVSVIEVKDTIKALGDMARFQRAKFAIPVIAVTGSNGKTTAKEMIAWVLSRKFKVLKNEGTKNNQIGLALTLLGLQAGYDIAVVEIGTNHFGEVDYLAKICQPNIAVITNIAAAHLQYLRDLEGVLEEKYALIKNLGIPRLAILNSDDPLLRRHVLLENNKPFILGFGSANPADFSASKIKARRKKIEFLANQKHKFILDTPGKHHIYNALVAIAVARIFGMGYKDIAGRLATFEFPAGRLKLVTLKKTRFIDDTYNCNPFSLKQALDTLANLQTRGRKIFVMGDMLELGSNEESFHCQVGGALKDICDVFIAVGRLSRLAAAEAKARGFNLESIFTCESTEEARDILFNKISAGPDDLVLVKGSRLMKMEEIIRE